MRKSMQFIVILGLVGILGAGVAISAEKAAEKMEPTRENSCMKERKMPPKPSCDGRDFDRRPPKPPCEGHAHGSSHFDRHAHAPHHPPRPMMPPFLCGLDMNGTQMEQLKKLEEAHRESMKKLMDSHMQEIATILDDAQKKQYLEKLESFKKHMEDHKPPMH